MSRNRPPVAIFVFSLLQMIAPISWWCTPHTRQGGGGMYTEESFNRCRPTHVLWKTPLSASQRFEPTLPELLGFILTLTRLSPPWESLLLKIFIPFFFFPFYFSTNFLSGEQSLEPFFFSFSVQLSLSLVLPLFFSGLFCFAPPDFSFFCCSYLGQFPSGVSPQLFISFSPPKNKTKGGYIYS